MLVMKASLRSFVLLNDKVDHTGAALTLSGLQDVTILLRTINNIEKPSRDLVCLVCCLLLHHAVATGVLDAGRASRCARDFGDDVAELLFLTSREQTTPLDRLPASLSSIYTRDLLEQ